MLPDVPKIYSDDLPSIALSVRQPWAWAIVHAGKTLENRTQGAINVGRMETGRIAIHASKGMTRDEYESALLTFEDAGIDRFYWPKPCDLVRGAVIGAVRVTGIVRESSSPWWCGPCALTLEDAQACEPVGAKGQLGYFEWQAFGEPDMPAAWMTHWPDDAPRAKRQKAARSDEPTLFQKADGQ